VCRLSGPFFARRPSTDLDKVVFSDHGMNLASFRHSLDIELAAVFAALEVWDISRCHVDENACSPFGMRWSSVHELVSRACSEVIVAAAESYAQRPLK
jgi:hypothetical protein